MTAHESVCVQCNCSVAVVCARFVLYPSTLSAQNSRAQQNSRVASLSSVAESIAVAEHSCTQTGKRCASAISSLAALQNGRPQDAAPHPRPGLRLLLRAMRNETATRRSPTSPVGVRQKHLVITSNYAARAFGIKKGDSLKEVKRKCPLIRHQRTAKTSRHYTEVSNAWRAFVASFVGPKCPVEKSGLDELFVDVTAGRGRARRRDRPRPRRRHRRAARERGAPLRPPPPRDETRAEPRDERRCVDVEAAGQNGRGPPQALPADRVSGHAVQPAPRPARRLVARARSTASATARRSSSRRRE